MLLDEGGELLVDRPRIKADDAANGEVQVPGAIVALGMDGTTEVGRWNFTKAWPVRWEMTDFDAQSGEAACEILELAVEKISRAP